MDIQRYIPIQAIKIKDNVLIPLWDERIVFEKTEMYGNVITLKNEYKHYAVIECLFDIKTKEIMTGIELDYYPTETAYKKGDTVLYEISNRLLGESKIKDIIYKEFELSIQKGKKIDNYYKKYFTDVTFDITTLYAIKQWKPFYLLENDVLIEWQHQLYNKSK